ncbi:MAG: hypothetical protein U7126_16085 [Microcoleus sp.]
MQVVAPSNSTSNDNRNTQSDRSDTTTHWVTVKGSTANRCQDWGEAIDVCDFYGCAEELAAIQILDKSRHLFLTSTGAWERLSLSKLSRFSQAR